MAANPHPEQTEQILLDAGLIDSLQLSAARKRMRRAGGTLPGSLVRMGLVPESRVMHLLSRGYSLGVADRDRLRAPQPAALEKLDFEDAWEHRVLPLRLEERGGQVLLEVALADPESTDKLARRPELKNVEFLRLVAGERELERAIEAAYDRKATPFRSVALDSASMRESIGQELYPLRESPPSPPAETPEIEPAPPAELELDTSDAGDEDLPEVELEVEPAETWQEVPASSAHLEAAGPVPEDEAQSAREDAMAEDPSFELVGVVENLPDKTSEETGPSKELVAIRVLLELLESKGILTREEYVAALRRAAKPD